MKMIISSSIPKIWTLNIIIWLQETRFLNGCLNFTSFFTKINFIKELILLWKDPNWKAADIYYLVEDGVLSPKDNKSSSSRNEWKRLRNLKSNNNIKLEIKILLFNMDSFERQIIESIYTIRKNCKRPDIESIFKIIIPILSTILR